MSDDQHQEGLEPIPTAQPVTDPGASGTTEPPTVEAPATEPTGEAPSVAPPPAPGTPTAAGPAPAPRRTVTMPLWAFVAVGGALLLGLGFLLGWAVAPDGDDDGINISAGDGREMPFGGNLSPFDDDNGNGRFGDRWEDGDGSTDEDTAFLGVVVQDSTDPDGAEIVQVSPSSPAADADLETGDVITEVDGDAVDDAAELTERIRSADPGDTVTIGYERDGEDRTVDVELDERSTFRMTPPTTSPRSTS
jgi:membrane-associated protease RseP (regulator of RpoE activity)